MTVSIIKTRLPSGAKVFTPTAIAGAQYVEHVVMAHKGPKGEAITDTISRPRSFVEAQEIKRKAAK